MAIPRKPARRKIIIARIFESFCLDKRNIEAKININAIILFMKG